MASTASWLTIEATAAVTTELRNAALRSFKVTTKLLPSTAVLSTRSAMTLELPSGRSIVSTRSQLNLTTSAVSALPSWKVTPSRIGNV